MNNCYLQLLSTSADMESELIALDKREKGVESLRTFLEDIHFQTLNELVNSNAHNILYWALIFEREKNPMTNIKGWSF